MKYLKTLNIWDAGIQNAIVTGQIKILPGQWLTCGTGNAKKCRFVRIGSGKTLHVIHWQGSAKATAQKFKNAINIHTYKKDCTLLQ